MSVLSKQFVKVRITAYEDGEPVDPTTAPVEMAFVPFDDDPPAPSWVAAQWETSGTGSSAAYYARCLVGPAGTVTLVEGLYDVYVKINDATEVPVLETGRIEIK
jgi:hypothetical protein